MSTYALSPSGNRSGDARYAATPGMATTWACSFFKPAAVSTSSGSSTNHVRSSSQCRPRLDSNECQGERAIDSTFDPTSAPIHDTGTHPRRLCNSCAWYRVQCHTRVAVKQRRRLADLSVRLQRLPQQDVGVCGGASHLPPTQQPAVRSGHRSASQSPGTQTRTGHECDRCGLSGTQTVRVRQVSEQQQHHSTPTTATYAHPAL